MHHCAWDALRITTATTYIHTYIHTYTFTVRITTHRFFFAGKKTQPSVRASLMCFSVFLSSRPFQHYFFSSHTKLPSTHKTRSLLQLHHKKIRSCLKKQWTRTEIPSSKRSQELERDAFSSPVALDLSGRTCAMPWSLCVKTLSFFLRFFSIKIFLPLLDRTL